MSATTAETGGFNFFNPMAWANAFAKGMTPDEAKADDDKG